jgi:enamine deaminase RidA (YjgF/YER057c/UK114 family)
VARDNAAQHPDRPLSFSAVSTSRAPGPEQAHAVLGNLVQLATAAGSSAGQVVKVTVHLADLKFFDEFNAVYQEYFTPPYPSRTTVGSQLRGILVEVDAIAVRHPRGTAQS